MTVLHVAPFGVPRGERGRWALPSGTVLRRPDSYAPPVQQAPRCTTSSHDDDGVTVREPN